MRVVEDCGPRTDRRCRRLPPSRGRWRTRARFPGGAGGRGWPSASRLVPGCSPTGSSETVVVVSSTSTQPAIEPAGRGFRSCASSRRQTAQQNACRAPSEGATNRLPGLLGHHRLQAASNKRTKSRTDQPANSFDTSSIGDASKSWLSTEKRRLTGGTSCYRALRLEFQ